MDIDRVFLPIVTILVAVLALALSSFRFRSMYVPGKGEHRPLARLAYALLGPPLPRCS